MGFAVAMVGLVAVVACGDSGGTSSPRAEATTSTSAAGMSTSSAPGPAPSSTMPGPTQASTAPATNTSVPATNSTAATTPTTAAQGAPTDFSVTYPTGWGPSGQVQATAFAAGATCRSALIVDRAPPAASGPGASIEQSYVQLCWKGHEGRTLAEFMAATYGSAGGFSTTTLAGRPAFVSRSGTTATFFVDTSARRYQVVTAVNATTDLTPTRQAEVERILSSLSLPS